MNAHRRALEEIADDPSLIGLHSIVHSDLEVPVYSRRGRIITDIDLFMIDADNVTYLAELKTGLGDNRTKAMRQLAKGVRYVRREFGIDSPVALYVRPTFKFGSRGHPHEGYRVEVVP